MGALEDMASAFVKAGGVAGLDWKLPASNGKAGYLLQIDGADLRMLNAVMPLSLDWTLTEEEARLAITMTKDRVERGSSSVWEAVKSGQMELAWNKAVQIPQADLRTFISALVILTDNGAALHQKGIVWNLVQSGKLSREAATKHAEEVFKNANTIVKLAEMGALDTLKPQKAPTSGLGILPAVIVWTAANVAIVAIASLIVVLGIAYMIYSAIQTAPIQAEIIESCKKIEDPALRAECMAKAAAVDPVTNAFVSLAGNILKPVGIVLAVGLAAYIGVQLLPNIVGAVRKTRTA